MIHEFDCGADMGSIKIMSKEMSCFFSNGFGDGEFKVFIYENKETGSKTAEDDFKFQGHFTSFGNCYLMAFDCSEFADINKLYQFSKGRWFVYLDEEKFEHHIIKEDDETNS